MENRFTLSEVIKEEDVLLRIRREKLFGQPAADKLDENRFGIALSGGGIRSATINLGLLKTLNRFGILKKADYLSTVSGGGYTGSYIQATLANEGDYNQLFHEEHINYLRARGDYMIPGSGFRKFFNRIQLIISFLISLLMSWASLAIILLLVYGSFLVLKEILPFSTDTYEHNRSFVYLYGVPILVGIFILHFIANSVMVYDLDISLQFNRFETALVGLSLLCFLGIFLASFRFQAVNWELLGKYTAIGAVLIAMGFFTNPNALSFHRYYRKQLADAFLHYTGDFKNIRIKDLHQIDSHRQADYIAPYPLINTCLNLQASKDKHFKGAKASDYFLLSPLYCGSKLTCYVYTEETPDYDTMTLPAAVTISAAAVNPGMGIYSNKILSILTTLFNARLGVWTRNPLNVKKTVRFVWWPLYFLYELFSKIGTDNNMVNISDGGHIENLAVYELLRRKCRLIIAGDGSADPDFGFSDMQNLTIRARNELGIDIRFRPGQIPEETIRPKPSHGYSERRFVVADLYQLWEETGQDEKGNPIIQHYENNRVGLLVYAKSSVKAPEGKPSLSPNDGLKYDTYKYKIYHPEFPHESTADQFFDPVQWEAYYQLGQYIGAELLGIANLETYDTADQATPDLNIEQLMTHFDTQAPLFETPTAGEESEITREVYTRPRTPVTMKEKAQIVEKDVKYCM